MLRVMKQKKHGQRSKRPTRAGGIETVCPRCRIEVVLEIKYPDAPKGSEQVECEVCGATLDVKYICSLEVDDVEVVETPVPEVNCPVCDLTIFLDGVEIDSETGSTELDCPGADEECGAELEVLWSDWGQETSVKVLSDPKKENDEEDEEDEDEDGDEEEDNEDDYDDDPDDDNRETDEDEDDEDP